MDGYFISCGIHGYRIHSYLSRSWSVRRRTLRPCSHIRVFDMIFYFGYAEVVDIGSALCRWFGWWFLYLEQRSILATRLSSFSSRKSPYQRVPSICLAFLEIPIEVIGPSETLYSICSRMSLMLRLSRIGILLLHFCGGCWSSGTWGISASNPLRNRQLTSRSTWVLSNLVGKTAKDRGNTTYYACQTP